MTPVSAKAPAFASIKPIPWQRGLRLLVCVAIVLWPWPGLPLAFASMFSTVANLGAAALFGDTVDIHFRLAVEQGHPWWVTLAVKNVFTAEMFALPVDSRTVAYVRIAIFAALAFTWPVAPTRRGIACVALGTGLLLITIVASVLMPLLQVLEKVHALQLGVVVQSVLSAGILSLDSYPSMAFALPCLLWWLTFRLAKPPSSASLAVAAAS